LPAVTYCTEFTVSMVAAKHHYPSLPPLGYQLRTAAQSGEFLVTAEVMPPKGGDPSHMLEMARLLKGRVHAVNITDGSRAVMRMASLAAATLLQQEGIEAICQVACRDRNSIGLQADLIGAHALGLRNILALTGDPVKAGDHPKARSVFELESVRLLKLIDKLNQGFDSQDKPLTDGALDLFTGAAVDPQSHSWSGLQRRFEAKIKAGAHFFQSQMITDFDRLAKFMDQIAAGADRPVLAGIFPAQVGKKCPIHQSQCSRGTDSGVHCDPPGRSCKSLARRYQNCRRTGAGGASGLPGCPFDGRTSRRLDSANP
jgi:methylenetetrahydrofolate reductase (NADPH)